MHPVCLAFSLALERAGKSMPARMAMMAMTTNSSMSVKPFLEAVDREDFMGKMDSVIRVLKKS